MKTCNRKHGHRDMYWCPNSNDPGFAQYPATDGIAVCGCCGVVLADNLDHEFLFHVLKPGSICDHTE